MWYVYRLSSIQSRNDQHNENDETSNCMLGTKSIEGCAAIQTVETHCVVVDAGDTPARDRVIDWFPQRLAKAKVTSTISSSSVLRSSVDVLLAIGRA